MELLPYFLLFLITLAGGGIPLWIKPPSDRQLHLLLAFSGSFLLGITFLHLLPETFDKLESHTGLYLLGGFFLQLVIQRITHGVEHGHSHIAEHDHNHHLPLTSVLVGLSIHAFMEGLPLGFHYRQAGTQDSLFLAVAAHKLPEAMLLAMLVAHSKGKSAAWLTLLLFSAITPVAAWLSITIGPGHKFTTDLVTILIAIVAGAFIHIATTIFFESGTRHHTITGRKVLAMLVGAGMAVGTLLLE